jgi:hypothetical protein
MNATVFSDLLRLYVYALLNGKSTPVTFDTGYLGVDSGYPDTGYPTLAISLSLFSLSLYCFVLD